MMAFYRIRKGHEVLVVLLKISLSAKLAIFVPGQVYIMNDTVSFFQM